MEKEPSRFEVEAYFVDTSDIRNIERRLRPETRLLFIETPANPTRKYAKSIRKAKTDINEMFFCEKK